MEWCNEKYLDFIEDFRKSEVLWDVRNSNYKNNRVKHGVLLGLAQKYNLDEKSVKKKIKNLRSAFHREHKRLTNKKSGSGSTKESKKWFAYESLQFILDVTEPHPGTASTINDTNIEENIDKDQHSFMSLRGNLSQNIEADMRPSTPSTSTNMRPPSTPSLTSQDGIYGYQTRKKKKRSLNTVPQTENERRAEEAYNVMKSSIKRDDCSTYGEHVGNELRKLSCKSQIYVKHMINNILFKAALGVYDNQQVTHETSISSTPDVDLNTNIRSPTILVSEPSPVELATKHEPIDRNRDDESQSVMMEYLYQ